MDKFNPYKVTSDLSLLQSNLYNRKDFLDRNYPYLVQTIHLYTQNEIMQN